MGFWKKIERLKFKKEVKLEENEEIALTLWGKLKSPDDKNGRSGVLCVLTNKYLIFFRHGVIRDSCNFKFTLGNVEQFEYVEGSRKFNFKLNEIENYEYIIDKEEPEWCIEDFVKMFKSFRDGKKLSTKTKIEKWKYLCLGISLLALAMAILSLVLK